MNFLANFFVELGSNLTNSSESACAAWFIDEPVCPKSLIK